MKPKNIFPGIFILLFFAMSMAFSQSTSDYDKDVSSIENIVEANLESISGGKGKKGIGKDFQICICRRHS